MSMNCISCVRMPRTGIDLLCDDCRETQKATAKLKSWAPAATEPKAEAKPATAGIPAGIPVRTFRIVERATEKCVHETPGQWTEEKKGQKRERQHFVMSAFSATKYTKAEAIEAAKRFGLSNETHKITNL